MLVRFGIFERIRSQIYDFLKIGFVSCQQIFSGIIEDVVIIFDNVVVNSHGGTGKRWRWVFESREAFLHHPLLRRVYRINNMRLHSKFQGEKRCTTADSFQLGAGSPGPRSNS